MKHAARVVLTALLLAAPLPAAAVTGASATQRPLTLDQAIAMALSTNEAILVQRESVISAEANVSGAKGAYDPALKLTADARRALTPVNSAFSGAPPGELAPTTHTADAGATLEQLLPTGALVTVLANLSRTTTNNNFTLLSPAYSSELGVEFRQPLLRGRSIDAGRLRLRVAAADRRAAGAGLRETVTDSVAAVERAYWSLVAARREISVRKEAVRLAEEQLEQTRLRVEAGAAPETEIAQPRAELENRRGDLSASRESEARAENTLKLLILGDDAQGWGERIEPQDDPDVSPEPIDVDRALQRALAARPEIEGAQAAIDRQRSTVEFSRNASRPALDAIVAYDRFGLAGGENPLGTGFAGAPPIIPSVLEGGWGHSLSMLGENRYSDGRVGLEARFTIGGRTAKADVAVAQSAARQAETLLSSARKTVRAEVLDAAAAMDTAGQRIGSSRAAREAAEVQLSAERDRYAAGLSTNFLVLTRQNDLSHARLDEISARTDYRKAVTEMARATGTLLADRRIDLGPADAAGSR
ncbi:MAG: TolC family protein [Acidobacteria bacterium]|nr:TolC family protein [Acidobacteriota bacterium]